MAELESLRQLLSAAPVGSTSYITLTQRIAQLAPSSTEVTREQVAVTRQQALAIEGASSQAVEADEVEAYQLTEQQATLLAEYRNQQAIAGSQTLTLTQGIATAGEEAANYERLVELGLV